MGAALVHIPWYATVWRADKLEVALKEIAPVAMRYGAIEYSLTRNLDDRYAFVQTAAFPDKLDFQRYWGGPEFTDWRITYASWYQIPVIYGFHDLVLRGALANNGDAQELPVDAGYGPMVG